MQRSDGKGGGLARVLLVMSGHGPPLFRNAEELCLTLRQRSATHRRIDFHHRRSAILRDGVRGSQQTIEAAAGLRV